MAIQVTPISKKKDIRKFIRFANDLYKDCPYYCPPLFFDEMNTFNPKKNPAMSVCEMQLFLAYRDGKIVGRIAAIINFRANDVWNYKHVRFGWFDFIDDEEVSRALLDAVVAWGKERGMTGLNGPVGFTDWDHEGLLLEGYDYLAPMASLYNYPYYVHHLENYGLVKEVDWVERQFFTPEQIPERLLKAQAIVQERFHFRVDKVHSAGELVKKYGLAFMDVLDEAYQKLYNFQPMTRHQKEYYRDMYFPIINFDFVSIVVNEENKVIGVGVGMPDISNALRKCGGNLFPFGWYHLIRALKAKKFDVFNFLLLAVLPEYQDKGVTSLIICDQLPYFSKYGIKYAESTSMLETNNKILTTFSGIEYKQHKRRRAYIKEI